PSASPFFSPLLCGGNPCFVTSIIGSWAVLSPGVPIGWFPAYRLFAKARIFEHSVGFVPVVVRRSLRCSIRSGSSFAGSEPSYSVSVPCRRAMIRRSISWLGLMCIMYVHAFASFCQAPQVAVEIAGWLPGVLRMTKHKDLLGWFFVSKGLAWLFLPALTLSFFFLYT
ncbi:hypothetical protein B0J12DRAFT_688144, partial [Macrophomina phaseolina]